MLMQLSFSLTRRIDIKSGVFLCGSARNLSILDGDGNDKKGVSMKNSLSLSILRLSLLLVLVGFFVPIGCDSNGYQIAQGIVGSTKQAGNAIFLESIENPYGYLLFGVFVFALLGLLFTFLGKAKNNFLLGSAGFAVSLIMLIIVVLRIKSFRDSGLLHLVLTIIPIKVKLLIGGYSMAIGYLAGVIGLALRFLKISK